MWNAGDVTCKATIPVDMESDAHFLAKEDGIIAGIALAEMIFAEVDPSLKVLILQLSCSSNRHIYFEEVFYTG